MATGPQLIQESISNDTLQCAKALLTKVQDGEVVGAVIGFIYRRRRYSVAVCGDAFSDPTWARGVTQAIDDELFRLVHERGLKDTTL